jgi:hypothetical protein
MRHICVLDLAHVPRNDEFKFRDRAKALVDKWHGLLNANVRLNYVVSCHKVWISGIDDLL